MNKPTIRRPIRSYVLRGGRMTLAQIRAYDQNWEKWGLAPGQALDFDTVFTNPGARIVEIGFGMGDSLAAMAAAQPDANFVGIEVHKAGVGKLLNSMAEGELTNIRIYCHDAVQILHECIADASLDKIQIFFPDPWHKKKHNKRRLVQSEFVAQLVLKLKPGGILHLATDWEDYALQMMDVLSRAPGLQNTCPDGEYSSRPQERPLTKFERRGERLGHGVWDLLFERVETSPLL